MIRHRDSDCHGVAAAVAAGQPVGLGRLAVVGACELVQEGLLVCGEVRLVWVDNTVETPGRAGRWTVIICTEKKVWNRLFAFKQAINILLVKLCTDLL